MATVTPTSSGDNSFFQKSVDMTHWAIVCLDDRTGQKIIKDFVFQLQDQADRCGFDIDNPKKAYSANRAQEVSSPAIISFLPFRKKWLSPEVTCVGKPDNP